MGVVMKRKYRKSPAHKKPFAPPKISPFFGFGINYLMINFPFIIFCKYGYTGTHSGIGKRQKSVNNDMPGIPIPVFFVPTFFAYALEQWFHDQIRPLRADFYKGQGHTETYWIIAVPFALVFMCLLWILNGCFFYYGALFVWGLLK
jgi:hypothetical protein